MARPIKETPVLTGKDAVRFTEKHERAKHEPVDDATLQRMRENYARISKLIKKK